MNPRWRLAAPALAGKGGVLTREGGEAEVMAEGGEPEDGGDSKVVVRGDGVSPLMTPEGTG